MTTSEEWSIEFDLLYNNISSNQAPGLTEYEKSVFLTQAQEALILDLYKGVTGDSFEATEEVTRYLSSLVRTQEFNIPNALNSFTGNIKEYRVDITDVSDLWFLTFQSGFINYKDNPRDVVVVPTKQDLLFKELNNPFKGPNNNRVLSISEDIYITLYSKYPMISYYIKYLKRPNPIVLEGSDMTINGESEFNVEIPEILHSQVLLRAVQLAKAVWQS